MKRIHAIAAVAVLAVCPGAADAAGPTYAKSTTIAGPDGGWDLASVDASSAHLYVARSGGVMRVDLADAAGLRHWCDHFGVTQEQLEEAVHAAGDDPAAVQEHLLNQGGSAGAG